MHEYVTYINHEGKVYGYIDMQYESTVRPTLYIVMHIRLAVPNWLHIFYSKTVVRVRFGVFPNVWAAEFNFMSNCKRVSKNQPM